MKKRIIFLISFISFFCFVTFVCFSYDEVEIPKRIIIQPNLDEIIIDEKKEITDIDE